MTNAAEDERKGDPRALLLGMELVTATMESSTEVSHNKLKSGRPKDPAIPLLGVYIHRK